MGGLSAAVIAAVILSIPALIQAAPADGGWGPVTEADNDIGQRLFQALAQKPGNIVLSPYSIGTAMAMVLAGARGGTEEEIANVIGIELPRDAINASNAALLANLNSLSPESFELRAANALMLPNRGGMISANYAAMLRKDYAADVFRGADVATVNAWVKEKTGGKIDSILDRIDPTTALVLLDAVYFKAPWRKAFDVAATDTETFHLLDGEAKVPMMHLSGYFAVADRPGYSAIRLRYTGERMSMFVMLPDAGMGEVVQRLDGHEMRLLLAQLHMGMRKIDLSLPRFKASFEASLVEPFMQMGTRRAFDIRNADFSGMTGKPQSEAPLAISQIMHRALIDVAEQGTEAAAATGIGVVTTAARPRPETFRVDRPFLFAIIDDETGAILFEGRIVDPRQAS
jgi:serpin B